MPETVHIEGLTELQAKLQELPEKVARRTVRSSLREAGDIVKNVMVALAPKDTGFLSVHFLNKISIKRSDELVGSAFIGPQGRVDYPKDGGYREKINRRGKAFKVGRIAVASVARFLEFGTSRMSKKPFMTQAFESSKNKALDTIISKLKQELGL